MSRATEGVSVRALQLVSLTLTVVTITAVATVAYSGYVEINYLQSGFQPEKPPFRFELVNGQQSLVLDLTLPNQGLYPLELSVGAAFMYKNDVIASAQSPVVTIAPRSNGTLSFILPMRLEDFLKNSELASRLQTGSAPINVTLTIIATVVPFLSVDTILSVPVTISQQTFIAGG